MGIWAELTHWKCNPLFKAFKYIYLRTLDTLYYFKLSCEKIRISAEFQRCCYLGDADSNLLCSSCLHQIEFTPMNCNSFLPFPCSSQSWLLLWVCTQLTWLYTSPLWQCVVYDQTLESLDQTCWVELYPQWPMHFCSFWPLELLSSVFGYFSNERNGVKHYWPLSS